MWPWGHAALGYVLFSVLVRVWPGRRVSDGPVLALVVATQVPDLLDKSLSWGAGVTTSGFSVGHSVFVAVPVGIAVCAALAAGADRPLVGVALLVGWWSHLLGDVLFGVVAGETAAFARVLWPAVTVAADPTRGGFLERIGEYLAYSVEMILEGGSPLLTAMLVGTPLVALVLWVVDGAPVLSGAIERIRPRGE